MAKIEVKTEASMSVPHSSTPKIEDIAIPETVEVAIMQWWNSPSTAFNECTTEEAQERMDGIHEAVKVALLSLATNPVVVTEEEIKVWGDAWSDAGGNRKGPYWPYCIEQAQRHMFLHKSELVPEEIKNLITNYSLKGESLECVMMALEVGKRIGREERDAG